MDGQLVPPLSPPGALRLHPSGAPIMRGLVIKSTGSSYIVRLDDGTNVECRIKGNLRIRGIRSTNPVAVGDYVEVKSQISNLQSPIDEEVVHWITKGQCTMYKGQMSVDLLDNRCM